MIYRSSFARSNKIVLYRISCRKSYKKSYRIFCRKCTCSNYITFPIGFPLGNLTAIENPIRISYGISYWGFLPIKFPIGFSIRGYPIRKIRGNPRNPIRFPILSYRKFIGNGKSYRKCFRTSYRNPIENSIRFPI